MKDSISQLLTAQLSNTHQGFKFLMKTNFDLDSLERGQFVNHESIGLPLAIPNSSAMFSELCKITVAEKLGSSPT